MYLELPIDVKFSPTGQVRVCLPDSRNEVTIQNILNIETLLKHVGEAGAIGWTQLTKVEIY
jgi:ribosomal protein L32E